MGQIKLNLRRVGGGKVVLGLGNRNVNQFQTPKSVRRDLTTYYILGVKYQMAGGDEGKEAKFSEPSIIIMLKKI